MPEANAINDITTSTNSESTKTQCEDIGKVWKRKCPTCEREIEYKYRHNYLKASRENCRCKFCYTRETNLGRIPTESARLKMSASQKGRKHSEETKKKMSGKNNGMFGIFRCGEKNPFYGKKHDEETRKKMRISALKRMMENGGVVSVGKKENDYFFSLEKETGWDGVFHGKSGKQFILWEQGYSLDYYEPNLNIVVEYDEPRHYVCGVLRSKDINRMNIIKSHLKCRFFRYNEKSGELSEY